PLLGNFPLQRLQFLCEALLLLFAKTQLLFKHRNMSFQISTAEPPREAEDCNRRQDRCIDKLWCVDVQRQRPFPDLPMHDGSFSKLSLAKSHPDESRPASNDDGGPAYRFRHGPVPDDDGPLLKNPRQVEQRHHREDYPGHQRRCFLVHGDPAFANRITCRFYPQGGSERLICFSFFSARLPALEQTFMNQNKHSSR